MLKEIWEKIYMYDSWKKWNITTIMVWVHGNEKSWIIALDEIINKLEITSWKVYFIYANLKAIKQNKRFIEKNMNRCFLKNQNWKTYEEKRVKEIMKILDKSDFLLDVHNTTSFNSSQIFLISEYKEFWKFFDVKYVISWFDKLHPWWSDGYMNSIWKKWFCIECGSINFGDKNQTIEFAKKSIINFLKVTKNIDWKPQIYNNNIKYLKFDYIHKNKNLEFKFTKEFKDFEFVEKWKTIAYDKNEKLNTKQDSYILFPYNPKKLNDECFCLGYEI